AMTISTGNIAKATLPKTWGLVIGAWLLISLLLIVGHCLYSWHELAQSRLDWLSLLQQRLNKRVEDTKDLLHSMAARIEVLDPEDTNSIELVLSSTSQLTPPLKLPGIATLLCFPGNNLTLQVGRFGVVHGKYNLPIDAIMHAPAFTLMQAKDDQLIFFKGVRHLGQSNSFIVLHLPIDDLTQGHSWGFIDMAAPEKKHLRQKIAEQAYGVLEESLKKSFEIAPGFSNFVRVADSNWIIVLANSSTESVYGFIAGNKFAFLLYLLGSFVVVLGVTSLQRFKLNQPFQDCNAERMDFANRLNTALDRGSASELARKRAVRHQELTANNYQQQNSIHAKLLDRQTLMLDQAKESAAMLTETFTGESKLSLTTPYLAQLGLDTCHTLENVFTGVFNNAFATINVQQMLDEIKQCFSSDIYHKALQVDIIAKPIDPYIKTDALLLQLLLLNVFGRSLARLPQDASLEISIAGDQKLLKLTFTDTGYADEYSLKPDNNRIALQALVLTCQQLEKIENKLAATCARNINKDGNNETVITLPRQIKVPDPILAGNVVNLFGDK
ncbi:MAG: hypothetical protein ABFQ95_07205, partial [Pseudomonadota bacterium]